MNRNASRGQLIAGWETDFGSADLKATHANQTYGHHNTSHNRHFGWPGLLEEMFDLINGVCPPVLVVEVVRVVHDLFLQRFQHFESGAKRPDGKVACGTPFGG